MKHSRNLILGAVTGYQPETIEPFVTSLKCSGFKGTAALFVDKRNIILRRYRDKNGILALPLSKARHARHLFFTRILNQH